MKRILLYAAACLVAVLPYACSKPVEPEAPPMGTGAGKVTPVGTPDGDPATQLVIGTAGGQLSSRDGKMKLTIPAGALAQAQTVSIERISNHNPMGIQQAYRITPHLEFAKPVSITFSYSEDDVLATIPEALGIAYQNAAGIWMAVGNVQLDKTNRTVTIHTTHFSDWSFFESFRLETSARTLPVKGTANLQVISDADLLAPLVNNERPIGEPTSQTGPYVKEWQLAGAGLLAPLGPFATYTAPATVPATQNPVAVSARVDFGKKGTYLVVANILITNDGVIEVRVNGGPWVQQVASPVVKDGDLYMLADGDGDERGRYILVTWNGGVGTHGFKPHETPKGTYAHYLINGGNQYTCYYMKNDNLATSGGGVTITSMDNNGFIEGTFDIQSAGYGEQLRLTHHVEGRFRVKKSW